MKELSLEHWRIPIPFPERRKILRHDLEPMVLLNLCTGNGLEYLCTIENISVYGLKVGLYCGECFASLPVGERFQVKGCDEVLADPLRERRLKLLWVEGGTAGLLFDKPLSLAATSLELLLEQNRLLPWVQWRECS